MENRNLYSILGIKSTSNLNEIKKAYYSLAKKFHPDKNKNFYAEAKFKQVTNAYEILSDFERRVEYDAQYRYAKFKDLDIHQEYKKYFRANFFKEKKSSEKKSKLKKTNLESNFRKLNLNSTFKEANYSNDEVAFDLSDLTFESNSFESNRYEPLHAGFKQNFCSCSFQKKGYFDLI